jgi:acyl-CoA oxidase
MTAEGDNSVLMQKVAKELLGMLKANTYVAPKTNSSAKQSLSNFEYVHYLFGKREVMQLTGLAKSMAMKMKQGENLFDVWMAQESDQIQAAARSYGERVVLEQFFAVIESVDSSLKKILEKLCLLYSLRVIEKDLGWFLTNKMISLEMGKEVSDLVRSLCAEIAPDCLSLVDSFGIPEQILHAPISSDWIGYNYYDNQGEVKDVKFY